MTRCAFVEWPDGLLPHDPRWEAIRAEVERAAPDLLITNEMPFGAWLANAPEFDAGRAQACIEIHEAGLTALRALNVPALVSSRPVLSGDRIANEAFALDRGEMKVLHHKQFFPNEAGWYEANWFHADDSGFETHMVGGLKVGVLLCTELMFNERARRYGRDGADLIVVPRATGHSHETWITAGSMAAIVSGSYVVSSNRAGRSGDGPSFGGRGLAFAPGGKMIGETSERCPIALVEIDPETAQKQKAEYPCYVADAG